ncbi:MAG: GDP-mannose 4,6-dehydratase, partial [Oscillospiraceae bacterium]|nr:GDP-mannose 4,6-dehydratase [Oscillospiraceae bacterium]
ETAALLNAVMPDCILHLAAQSSVAVAWEQPQVTANINIIGTLNLLEAAKNLPQMPSILLTGSAEEYGTLRPEQIPVSEETPLHPENIYAATKAAAEQLAAVYFKSCGLPVICVRAFNHIGPGQRTVFAVADFCRQAAEIEAGLHEAVIRTGNLSAKRDFTDVRDIVRGYALLLQNGKAGQCYNIGSGKATALSEILEMIRSCCRAPFTVMTDQKRLRPVDGPVIAADISKLRQDTGWAPEIPLIRTVTDMLNEHRSAAEAQGKR